jgi:predicted PurR-regulated permease PerM
MTSTPTPMEDSPSRTDGTGTITPVEHPGRSEGWASGEIVRATALVIGVVALAVGLWQASTVVFTVFLGVLFGLAISDVAGRLARFRCPRPLGALLVVVGGAGLLVLIGALLAPTLIEQGREIRVRLPEGLRQIQTWVTQEQLTLRRVTGRAFPSVAVPVTPSPGPRGDSSAGARQNPGVAGGAGVTSPAPNNDLQVSQGVSSVEHLLFGFVGSTVEIVVYLLLILFLSLYIASDPGVYHRGLIHLVPLKSRARAELVFARIAIVLRQWLLSQLVAMVTLGVAWAIALSALHVKAAIALAVIAGLLEFVPTIGPVMAVVPALSMALLDSPTKALSVLGVYVVIQALESNLLIPMLMQGRLELPPALTITAQALMTLAFGFIGLMVAVPVTAAILVPVKLLYVEDVVGDDVERHQRQTHGDPVRTVGLERAEAKMKESRAEQGSAG